MNVAYIKRSYNNTIEEQKTILSFIKESDYQKIIEDINAQKLKGQHLHIENIYLDDNEYSLTDNHKMLRIRTTNNKDVELTFKFANSVPNNYLIGFGETGTGSPIYWGKTMFHNENGTLYLFVDNGDIRLSSSTSTITSLHVII